MDTFGTHKRLRSGDMLLREGEMGDEMYIVRSGKIRIFKGRGADAVTLAILGPGEYVGEMSLLGEYPRSASAAAQSDTEVTAIDRHTFRGSVTDPIVLDIMHKMADRIRELDKTVVQSQHAENARRAHLDGMMEQRHWFV